MILTKEEREKIMKITTLLNGAFIWQNSPQGHHYWTEVKSNLLKLTKEPVSVCEMYKGELYKLQELEYVADIIIYGEKQVFIKGGNIGVRLIQKDNNHYEVVESYEVL